MFFYVILTHARPIRGNSVICDPPDNPANNDRGTYYKKQGGGTAATSHHNPIPRSKIHQYENDME